MLRFFKSLGLVVLVTVLQACASQLQIEQSRIYDAHTKRQITAAELVQQLSNHQFILLGEKHTESKHHQAHLFLLEQLVELQSPVKTVVVEMLPTAEQNAITAGQQRVRQSSSISSTELANLLRWSPEWDWAMYQHVMTFLANSALDIKGGNLSQAEIHIIKQGAEPLQGQVSTTEDIQQKLASLIAQHHAMSPEVLKALVQVQQFKDRRMAETMVKSEGSVVLKAGNIHVRKDIGVPMHLQEYGEQDFVVVIIADSLDAEDLDHSDYVWVIN
ncbi:MULTISPECIES: ChaN family lipoprotein [Oligella]|uniref:Haem-binding uptake Tiki superfamily ChaN domain-containing protein n=1 Tax=Oligella urethralis DNF00040 TaxID=1401065 RepID=A0A096A5V0_9BURK|nr:MULTISPECIES: ChaN family lipoprotein [Oligella]KGF26142.1 hypothetical protein HMPREF2130_10590 [Oligella urethralis DNF00040]OFS87480.1 hypothetical protein HMPREF3144_03710 [Oligella sp. HMSC05A10]PMC15079.1 hypothetical protein CJ230_11425 [Oligella urethralis]